MSRFAITIGDKTFSSKTSAIKFYKSILDRYNFGEILSDDDAKFLIALGYKEEGTTTTPFDMVVLNDMDRFHLVMDVMERVPKMRYRAVAIKEAMYEKLAEHKRYIERYGEDMPEILNWTWDSM